MQKTVFNISKMDCPSEEQLIRMKLDGLAGIKSMEFDLSARKLTIIHTADQNELYKRLSALKLDTTIVSTTSVDHDSVVSLNNTAERSTLWAVLTINFSFFALEFVAGLISKSMGLAADSLDMLADSIVYALALMAVGSSVVLKKKVARFAGIFQIILALIGLSEVVRRFIGIEKMPNFATMIVVSALALAANIVCLYLLQKSRSKEAHMQASMIFTSNDIIINAGVIIAAFMVYWLDSSLPDLLIGAIVFVIVARGAYRILKLSK